METKFTKAMDYFNAIINQVEKGSKEYKLMCEENEINYEQQLNRY